MKNKSVKTLLFIFVMVFCWSCSTKNADSNKNSQALSFLQKGKDYVFGIQMVGIIDVKILDIDQSSNWVKVETNNKGLNNSWVNVNAVNMIRKK